MQKEDRKKQILDAAMSVFIEKGFNGSTTLEIAKAANISEVTLFRYFSSKKEIFFEGIEPVLLTTLEGSINTQIGLTTEEKLTSILFERISLLASNYRMIKLILAETSLVSELGTENFLNRIQKILKTMLVQIGVPIEDKEFALRLLMGSMLSFLYMPEGDEDKIRSYIGKVVTLILKEPIHPLS